MIFLLFICLNGSYDCSYWQKVIDKILYINVIQEVGKPFELLHPKINSSECVDFFFLGSSDDRFKSDWAFQNLP